MCARNSHSTLCTCRKHAPARLLSSICVCVCVSVGVIENIVAAILLLVVFFSAAGALVVVVVSRLQVSIRNEKNDFILGDEMR